MGKAISHSPLVRVFVRSAFNDLVRLADIEEILVPKPVRAQTGGKARSRMRTETRWSRTRKGECCCTQAVIVRVRVRPRHRSRRPLG